MANPPLSKPRDPDRVYKQTVGLVFFGLLIANAAFALFLISDSGLAKSNGIAFRYKLYMLPGPFFKEENIRSVAIFEVRFKKSDSTWSGWINPERANFHAYQHNLGLYHRLKQSDFERHLARELAIRIVHDTINDPRNFHEFKEVDRYLAELYGPVDLDSVHLLYRVKWVKLAGKHTHIDTLINLRYKHL